MCDYSLQHVASRPAKVGDRLETHDFNTGTRGFAARDELGEYGNHVAVCVLPGTELAFEAPIVEAGVLPRTEHTTAIFRQINKECPHMHHDALELPDGTVRLLTYLSAGQHATVLQLPAKPVTQAEVAEQRRVEVVG